jgi:hypothetical protein
MDGALKIEPTRDVELLRRWMLRPSFVASMAGAGLPITDDLEASFVSTIRTSRFFAVTRDGNERGVIIFKRSDPGVWELHLCLATWFTHTRVAVRSAIAQLCQSGERVAAFYAQSNRAVTQLLDDLGFSPIRLREFAGILWCDRELVVP